MIRILAALLPAALLAVSAAPAAAQTAGQDRRPSHCIAIAEAPGLQYVHRASFRAPLPDEWTVRLNYVDHAMFLLETAGGLTAVTDFNGRLGTTDHVPDVVTMNRAHITHWTADPDPRIPHVLPGWSERVGEPAGHHLDLGEMLVRSVSTDIRSGFRGVEPNGNSIFVFEVGGLCIGHLGHLHHVPDDAQFAALGRLDVVMAPVDGGLTLTLPEMIATLTRLRSSVVIPMHWFGRATLEDFLVGMSSEFAIDRRAESFLEVSLNTLPREPTVIVLNPRFLRDEE
jgi:L-ascorbate metabolism protein UlaG (beta-lactamase superfamily)